MCLIFGLSRGREDTCPVRTLKSMLGATNAEGQKYVLVLVQTGPGQRSVLKMRKATIMEALESTAPQPVSLICTPRPDGGTNLAPVAWWTYLESEPPIIGFSMAKESYTCELVSNTGKVAVCLPSESIADQVLECGGVSGRDVDKAAKHGIELTGKSIKYPVHSRLVFVCNVGQKVIVGDCVFFICNVDEILLDENQRHIYTMNGSQGLRAVQ